jgi:hypothetical protein
VSLAVYEPSPEEIQQKLRDLKLEGRWLIRAPKLMELYGDCSSAYIYTTLVGPGRPLGEMVVLSDKMTGIPADRVARHILMCEHEAKGARPRFKTTKENMLARRPKRKSGGAQ